MCVFVCSLDSWLWSLTTSGDDPRYGTLYFLFMTPYFFHERSKARHSPFPVYDPLLFPQTIRGTALSISCLWPLTFSTNDPRYGTLHSFPVYDPLLFPLTIQGTALSIHFLFMTPYFFHERSKARHSPFPVYGPLLFPRAIQGTALSISCLWSVTCSKDYVYFLRRQTMNGTEKGGGSQVQIVSPIPYHIHFIYQPGFPK